MPEKPLISIITVNLNDIEGLKRTMTSVFEQTWQEFEYIVIDGGSTDGSKEYIKNNNDKVDYWISEKDSGIYNAMNKGIKAATGEYLLFLNSGDELNEENVLDRNIKFINIDDIVYFDIFLIFANKTFVHVYPPCLDYQVFLKGSIGHPTTFIKRYLFDKIGYFDESLKIVADWKFFIFAIVKYNCSSRKVNDVLSKFYMNGISSNNETLVKLERQKVLDKNFKDYLRLNELEYFSKNIKRSLIIKLIRKLGLLRM